MPDRTANAAILATLLAALVSLSVLMQHLSYEVWAAALLVPLLATLSLLGLRAITRRRFPHLFAVLALGLLAKFVAAALRFYVFASVYSGGGDARLYYSRGLELAGAVRRGDKSLSTVLPWETSLDFMYRLTGLVLTVVGPTEFGAFLVFAMMGYWGMVLLVLAACRAVPGLQQRRLAWMCALAPSLLFWPSSIGKEAVVLLGVGLLSTGVSRLFTWDRRRLGLAEIVLGGAIIGAVRAHLAAIFVAGVLVALFQLAFVPATTGNRTRKAWSATLAVGAAIALSLVSWVAVRQLGVDNPNTGFFDDVTAALDKASVVSDDGGTSFEPVDTDNPLMWPYAVVRTLTRPLPVDIDGVKTLLPTLETSLLLVLMLAGARRIRGVLAVMRRSPYLTYAFVTTALFGLAFSAIANLGALIRQRSLVWAFLILLVCLPERGSEWPPEPDARGADTGAGTEGRAGAQPGRAGAAASRA